MKEKQFLTKKGEIDFETSTENLSSSVLDSSFTEQDFSASEISKDLGLSSDEVAERVKLGYVNINTDPTTKSYWRIFCSHFFTLFNLINLILGIMVMSVGSFKNALFLFIACANVILGIIQEIKAKKTIEKLSLITAPKAKLLRDGKEDFYPIDQIVLDDVMILESGNQICSDSVIVEGSLEVNESMLTGESNAIVKKVGDGIHSGSYVISGNAKAQVVSVGKDNYASKISAGAKYIKKVNSEILKGVKNIIRFMTFVLIPTGIFFLVKKLLDPFCDVKEAMEQTVASMIGMIPEGLVLLVTSVFTLSVVRLAKHNTLVQDLYCIETLARVDVLCLDKTGTITEGKMQVDEVIPIENNTLDDISSMMKSAINALKDNNPTAEAIRDYFTEGEEKAVEYTVPFSSANKYSGVKFTDGSGVVFGAGEFILKEDYAPVAAMAEEYLVDGKRILTVVKTTGEIDNGLCGEKEPIGFLVISDKIRAEAPDTLRFFAEEGVTVKIISGDNPVTVSCIAKRAGLQTWDKYVDASTLTTPEELNAALSEYTIFGRVTPDQKLEIVKQLKQQGHIVGMTGDGVNDVLALKESDCSVAMASGSDAARSVSSLVLLDNNFASMPKVVAEGRQMINNLQRSSSLFLIKTIYASVLAILFLFVKWDYPFEAIQLSLISTCVVGIPSVILALEPNRERIKGHFIKNALKSALPVSITIVVALVSLLIVINSNKYHMEPAEQKTMAVVLLGFVMYIALLKICYPLSFIRVLVLFGSLTAFIICVTISPFRDVTFELVLFSKRMYLVEGIIALCIVPIFISANYLVNYWFKKSDFKVVNKLMSNIDKVGSKQDRDLF